jgi:hypothetical protein
MKEPVCKCGLAVIHMRDDAEIADLIGHFAPSV